MSSTLALVGSASAVAATVAIFRILRIGRRESDIPPGPPTRPILGNLLDYPQIEPHLVFTEWAKSYGEVFSLKMANGTIICLNSPQAVRYVLDTKNFFTAERPDFYVLNYITSGLHLGFIKYGEWNCKPQSRY